MNMNLYEYKIGLDFDGVVANYGNHVTTYKSNRCLLALLPAPQPVVIITNQGGMVFYRSNPAKYPSPRRVADRLTWGVRFLEAHGYPVLAILSCSYHPKNQKTIQQSGY